MKSLTVIAGAGFVAAAAFILLVPTWNRPPYTTEEIAVPANDQFQPVATGYALNKAPPPLPARGSRRPRPPRPPTRTCTC